MSDFIKEIQTKFSNHDDFFIEEELVDNTVIYLFGFNTLIDLTKSKLYVQQMAASSISIKALFINLSGQINVNTELIINAILEGNLVILSQDGEQNAIVDPMVQNLRSSIAEPKNESPIYSSLDAFGEDINTNVGMIRKRLSTERLCHCSYQVGVLEKRKLSMLYIEGGAPNALIEKVNQQFKKIKSDIETIDDLNKEFGQRRLSPVSHLFATELPIQAIHSLKKNRIVIFLDNCPFALVFPHLLWDMLISVNDRNFPYVLSSLLRIFRVIGAIATLILPALYVALVSVNPEVFKTDLALFVAKSREGIPLSAFLEAIAMVVLVDLILEAIVRLPKSVGPAITMVGGVILGQAIVEAKLVSNLLVIVITAVVIASSAVIGMQNSLYIRLLKYPILILASIFGILGVCIGFIFTVIYLASLTSNDIPYITFHIEQKGDTK
ncbi:spore gernimation protein GerA [Bacillus sp. AFS077874]|uniref:spore germination protein n=1 Tax=unclassified Bacillus (in: firmicutes) TaxID=185979 RepID=UPI000BEC910B|nr:MULTISPECIES: spore germination protein [unclassified Bacillus (in: firmicutes)]PEC50971.1 spore gernimation protein GerA [Bacillus sp. AFS096315]PET71563.1 spore gernimation protein GerA [Bacillus sp. AFS001701]PFM83237.1 spore gernimation protein GerA [Bacillus sp. AFS077874]